MNRTMFTILRVLDKYGDIVGSGELSREFEATG